MPIIDPVEFQNALATIRDYVNDNNAPPSVDAAVSLLEELPSSEDELRMQRWFATFDAGLNGALAAGSDSSVARSRAKSHADAVHGPIPPGLLATIF